MKNSSLFVIVAFICVIGNAYSQSHLLLSEIALAPSTGEFIEIYNPTDVPINLDNYYLADNSVYAYLPSGVLNLNMGDFIVRFPSGYSIQPDQVMVIAMNGTDFLSTYSVTPDFEITSQDPGIADMTQIQISGTPTITNDGEGIILFCWDGFSDLVQDVDMMNAGVPTPTNKITAKTGILVDGPDPDVIPSSYLPDAVTIPVQSSIPELNYSTKRILFEDGFEISGGGNGITGNDETSENIALTWDNTFTDPDPGTAVITTHIENIFIPQDVVQIYPNPSSDYFIITFNSPIKKAEVTISDMRGKIFFTIPQTGEQKIEVKVNDFAGGIYFVRIETLDFIISKKLIVKK